MIMMMKMTVVGEVVLLTIFGRTGRPRIFMVILHWW